MNRHTAVYLSERKSCDRCNGTGIVDGHDPSENCRCGLVQAACPECRPEDYCAACGREIYNEFQHVNQYGHKPVPREIANV